MTLAVYAGSFDPLTVGHLWMIEQGVELFGSLTVAVGVNPEKRPLLPLEARLELLRRSTSHLSGVRIESFTNRFLIAYAQTLGVRFILRGVRNETDYTYERAMRNVNGDLAPGITTVFLMPPRAISEVSSSLVKSMMGPEGWQEIVKSYVPAPVFEKLVELSHAKPA
jgi:pantetheine-phosphate adenylyltransferase